MRKYVVSSLLPRVRVLGAVLRGGDASAQSTDGSHIISLGHSSSAAYSTTATSTPQEIFAWEWEVQTARALYDYAICMYVCRGILGTVMWIRIDCIRIHKI